MASRLNITLTKAESTANEKEPKTDYSRKETIPIDDEPTSEHKHDSWWTVLKVAVGVLTILSLIGIYLMVAPTNNAALNWVFYICTGILFVMSGIFFLCTVKHRTTSRSTNESTTRSPLGTPKSEEEHVESGVI